MPGHGSPFVFNLSICVYLQHMLLVLYLTLSILIECMEINIVLGTSEEKVHCWNLVRRQIDRQDLQ